MRFWHRLEQSGNSTHAFVASVCEITNAFLALTELEQRIWDFVCGLEHPATHCLVCHFSMRFSCSTIPTYAHTILMPYSSPPSHAKSFYPLPLTHILTSVFKRSEHWIGCKSPETHPKAPSTATITTHKNKPPG